MFSGTWRFPETAQSFPTESVWLRVILPRIGIYHGSTTLVHIASSKSDLFLVCVAPRQRCPLSPLLFIIFTERVSLCIQGSQGRRHLCFLQLMWSSFVGLWPPLYPGAICSRRDPPKVDKFRNLVLQCQINRHFCCCSSTAEVWALTLVFGGSN